MSSVSGSLIGLTEEELPLSSVFIDFISRWLDDPHFNDEQWADQISERLTNSVGVMKKRARARLERLQSETRAQIAIASVYRWFHDLATGDGKTLEELHKRFRFVGVVGLGRTGGSYLTAELFASLGYDPTSVPAVIAHDGFPNAQPFGNLQADNTWIETLMSVSEYLAMLEVYFAHIPAELQVIVPKKLTKGVYAGGLFNAVFGPGAQYIVTIRHPIANCISTYEKSGGLPSDRKVETRSNIEHWIKRDLMATGLTFEEFSALDYFEAYARYWELYHVDLAMTGLLSHRSKTFVPFGKDRMELAAAQFHDRHGSSRRASTFVSASGLLDRHPEWVDRSEQALRRVESVWNLANLAFPTAELRQGF